VQPWWFIFQPRRLLAKSMWAEGARNMRLADFVTTVLHDSKYYDKKTARGAFPDPFTHADDLKLNQHYALTHVLTNAGDEVPEYAGMPFFWCRVKLSLSDGGTQSSGPNGFTPPSEIVNVLKACGHKDQFLRADVTEPVVEVTDEGTPTDDVWDYFRYG
jgi:hypothetical protein